MVANNNAIPPQGTPGIFDPRNPTLLPNFDTPVVPVLAKNSEMASVGLASTAGFLLANPRTDATATATLGGTVTTGDELTIEFTNPILGAQGLSPPTVAKTVTAGGSDTLATLAEAFATAFNDDPFFQAADIRVDAAAGVLTFRQAGPIGNLGVLTSPNEGPITVTVGGTAHTGDRIAVLFTGPGLGAGGQLVTVDPTTGNTATQMGDALVAAIAANATLVAAGISGVNTAGAVLLTIPAGDFNVTSWANSIAPTATVGGTPGLGDTINLTFTNASLPGGARIVSYTATLLDTTTDLVGQHLAAAINADPVLATAGITAADATSVVTISYPGSIGQLRFSRSVTGGTTLTLLAAPTTTAVTSSGASETITFSNSGKLANGDGPVIATNNFTWGQGGQTQAFFYGKPYSLGFDMITTMVAQGMPIV